MLRSTLNPEPQILQLAGIPRAVHTEMDTLRRSRPTVSALGETVDGLLQMLSEGAAANTRPARRLSTPRTGGAFSKHL